VIVAISGLLEDSHGHRRVAGAGKDEAAVPLLQNGFVSVAFADIMKRICVEVFGFTVEQCWGPSEERAKEDTRYPRNLRLLKTMVEEKTPEQLARLEQLNRAFSVEVPSDPKLKKLAEVTAEQFVEMAGGYLTVRYALQKLGDWGRDCYPDIWANKALEIAKKITQQHDKCHQLWGYTPQHGLIPWHEQGDYGLSLDEYPTKVVIPDCRFQNEFRRVKEEGGKIIRVKRRCIEFPSKLDDSHVSERDILAWGAEKFDHVIENNGTVEELHTKVLKLLNMHVELKVNWKVTF
jgi:hypothetical protein